MNETLGLAAGVYRAAQAELPPEVRAATVRALLDVVGTCVAAAPGDAVTALVRHATALDGTAQVPVPGRVERLDAHHAALVAGFAGRNGGADAVHLPTGVHPTAAVFGAALPMTVRQDVTPARMLDALALGVEVQLRVALAMTRTHADQGWDVTGTVGSLGAAVTAGVLRSLDAEGLGHALAIATSMSLGHGEDPALRGLHAGKAAANGQLAATLAARGFTGSATALEGPRGYFRTLAPDVDPGRLTAALGTAWHCLELTHDTGSGSTASSGQDAQLDERASALVERTLPGRGHAVVTAVRTFAEQPDCQALLDAITPEGR